MNVMIDPRFAFGRRALRGSGITTSATLERFTTGESTDDLARDHGNTVAPMNDAARAKSLPIPA